MAEVNKGGGTARRWTGLESRTCSAGSECARASRARGIASLTDEIGRGDAKRADETDDKSVGAATRVADQRAEATMTRRSSEHCPGDLQVARTERFEIGSANEDAVKEDPRTGESCESWATEAPTRGGASVRTTEARGRHGERPAGRNPHGGTVSGGPTRSAGLTRKRITMAV